MIEALKLHNIEKVEGVLGKLMEPSKDYDLHLPAELHNLKFGGIAAAIQLIITWARRHPNSRIFTYVKSSVNPDEQVNAFSLWDHWLAAVLMADDVLAQDGQSIRVAALRAARQRLSEMQSVERPLGKGPERLYLSVAGNLNAQLRTLYRGADTPTSFVKAQTEFHSLIRELLGALPFTHELEHTKIPRIASILHELFKNTDQWARTDLKGVTIRPAVRGIRLELHHHSDRKWLQQYVGDSRSLSEFVANVPSPLNGRFCFVETSVFDSGPGMAHRLENREIPEDDFDSEHAAVVRCLKKWGSTSPQRHRGVGLHEVMTALTDTGGFLRLRTGRLSLQRDFAKLPYRPLSSQSSLEEPFLLDWQNGAPLPTKFPRVEGTLLTMLIPIHRKR